MIYELASEDDVAARCSDIAPDVARHADQHGVHG